MRNGYKSGRIETGVILQHFSAQRTPTTVEKRSEQSDEMLSFLFGSFNFCCFRCCWCCCCRWAATERKESDDRFEFGSRVADGR